MLKLKKIYFLKCLQIRIQFSFQSNRTKVSFMFVLRQSHGHMLLNTITSSTERRKRWPYFSMRSFSIMHWFWSTIWSSKRKMGAIHSFSWANRSFTLSLTKTSDSLEKPMSEFPTLEKGRHSDSLYFLMLWSGSIKVCPALTSDMSFQGLLSYIRMIR